MGSMKPRPLPKELPPQVVPPTVKIQAGANPPAPSTPSLVVRPTSPPPPKTDKK